jgi:hypothetical protein
VPRYCFQLQVRPERMAEYRERHRAAQGAARAATVTGQVHLSSGSGPSWSRVSTSRVPQSSNSVGV